jgi:predicted alpha/beta-hydrolase family hydrolase
MRVYEPKSAHATFVLAHGAGAGQSSAWIVRYARALAKRGLRVITFDFPGSRKNEPLENAYKRIVVDVRKRFPGEPLAIGGKSMGGRIASQLASKEAQGLAPSTRRDDTCALVFFGYPLHPPGTPEKRRDAHLPSVRVPMLFISGTRDPFATPRELRALTKKLGASLSLVDGGDHSLHVPKASAVPQRDVDARVWDETAAFVSAQLK